MTKNAADKNVCSKGRRASSFAWSRGVAAHSVSVIALYLASAAVTPAIAIDWQGGTNSDWFDGTNWNGGVVPSAPFDVEIVYGPAGAGPGINGSTANTANIRIGHDFFAVNDGQLIIFNNGILNSQIGYIDHNPSPGGMNGVVLSSGGQWNNTQLIVGNADSGRLAIEFGGTVTSSINSAVGLSGTGKGEVVITGTGSEWLIANGDLTLGDSGEGIMKIANGGTMNVQSGAGTVYIARNANSFGGLAIGGYANDPAEAAGILSADKIEFGDGTGNLLFNHTDTGYNFSPDISGSGTITHVAGETIFSGNWGMIGGQAYVTGGQFYVNGSLGSGLGGDVIVTGNGTLGGTGLVVSAAIQSGGTLAPGNSIGTLNMFSATFEAGSLYEVELSDGGFVAGVNNDLLDSTNVTINGGTVHVTPENGTDDGSTYTPGTYTIVTSANPLVGTGFDNVTDDFAFLNFTLDYSNPNSVLLNSSMAAPTFCLSSMTGNQCAVGDGVFSLRSGALFNAVMALSNGEAPIALDQLSGEVHGSVKTALLEDSRFPREAAQDRLRVALGGVGADSGSQIEDRIFGSFSMWGQGFGSWGQWDGDGNAAALDRTIGGFLMGGDALVWDDMRFGVLGGYSRSNFSVDERLSSGTADTYTLGVYGGKEWDAFTLTGGLAHSWHSLDTSRSIAFSGFSDSLSASYGARTLQVWGEAAHSFEKGAARFEPFANLAYVNLSTEDFTEQGGAAALTAASNVVDATIMTLGLRAETDVVLGTTNATLRGMLGWRHAFGDTPTSQMRFASAGDTFTIASAPLARDVLVLDVGGDVNLTDNTTLGLVYGGQFGSGVQDHSANLSLNVQF